MSSARWPPSFLLDGRGLNVSNPVEWLVTLPGDIESVLALPALARLVPLRFFRIGPHGTAEPDSAPVEDDMMMEPGRDPWETEKQYRLRVDRIVKRRECERRLYAYEAAFAAQVETKLDTGKVSNPINVSNTRNVSNSPGNVSLIASDTPPSVPVAPRMYWVVFPSRPKMPKDPLLRTGARYVAVRTRLQLHDECAPLRALMAQGHDYSGWKVADGRVISALSSDAEYTGAEHTEWRVLGTTRATNGSHAVNLLVDTTSGNFQFAVESEQKVGFVVARVFS
jgi:hypothetical protein